MRKLVAAAFVSLDGVMQAPGGPEEDRTGGFELGGWVAPYWDEEGGAAVDALHEAPFDLLLGRRTYDIFAAYWPYMTENPIGRKYEAAGKHVVTTSDMTLSWAGSRAVPDIDGVSRLKQSEGPNLLMWGSSTLYPQLLERGLIDRLVLMTFPVVLGSGKRVFGSGTSPRAMKLVDSKTSGTGVLIAHYEPAGNVETGSFETQAPSEAELARREKMRREG